MKFQESNKYLKWGIVLYIAGAFAILLVPYLLTGAEGLLNPNRPEWNLFVFFGQPIALIIQWATFPLGSVLIGVGFIIRYLEKYLPKQLHGNSSSTADDD